MITYINGHPIQQVLTNAVEITQAEYDLLPTAQKNSGTYIIIDAEPLELEAEDIGYDNTSSGLTADNVQDAVDELKENITVIDKGTCTFPEGVTNIGTNLIRENNSIVWLSATVQKSLTLSSWNNLIELPSGYYRNEVIRCVAFNGTKGYAVEAEITTGGIFRIYPTLHDSDATVQNIAISTMFILG